MFNFMLSKIVVSLIASFLFILLIILSIHNQDFDKHNDPHEYAYLGKSIWSGEGLRYNNSPDVVLPPGLPIFIGAVNILIDDLEWSGKILGIVSFLLSMLFIYKIAFFFFTDKTYSALAVLLFATNSNLLINATNGYGDSLFTFVFLVLAWLTIAFKDSTGAWPSIMFMILWPVLYYIRPEGVIIGLILFCWFVFDSKPKKQFAWLIPVAFAILIFPYLLFLKEYTGSWQLSGKTYLNLVMGELDSPYQKERSDKVITERYNIIDQTLADPSLSYGSGKYWGQPENDIFQRIPFNLIKWVKIYWLTFSIVGILLWIWGFYRFDRKNILFLLSLLLPACVYLIFFILPRTVAIYHWIGIIFIISGLRNMKLFIESKFHWKHADKLVWTVVILLSMYQIRSVAKVVYTFLA